MCFLFDTFKYCIHANFQCIFAYIFIYIWPDPFLSKNIHKPFYTSDRGAMAAICFVRLLFIVMTCLAIHKVEAPKGGSRQRTSSQQAKNSDAGVGITSENLESHYVRLFFDQMEEGAHKLLEQRIGEFLLSKQISKAGSSSGARGKALGKAKNAANADELLTKVHLTELKAILVGKSMAQLKKSEMAKRFGKASDEEVLEAKAKMRRLVGRRMFLELEIQEPFLLRINLLEQSEYLLYYKEILSAPVAKFLKNPSVCRLYIPIIFGHLLETEKWLTRTTSESEANVKAEVDRRRKKVLEAIKKNIVGLGATERELIPKMAEVIYNKLVAFLLKDGNSLFKEEGVLKSIVELNVAESARIMEEHRTLLRMLLQKDPEHQLQNFIRQTRGVRSRFCEQKFDSDEDYRDFLAWTESDFKNRLMQEYILALTAKTASERLKAQMSADILVQVHFLDRQFEDNEAIKPQWLSWRGTVVTVADRMVDMDENDVNDFGTLYKHMLNKLRNQKQPNEGDHWDFEAFFAAERQLFSQWQEFTKAGKKRPPYLSEDPQEAEAQAEWLDMKHREMVVWLQDGNAEFKEEFEANSSTRQGLVHLSALFNSHLRHKKMQEITEEEKGGKQTKSYYKCPKNMGIVNIKPDAEFRPYIEYLSGKTEIKYQIHLNALMNAYAAIIAELLGVYPANDVEKLREDWAQENNNLLENEQRMIKEKLEPEKMNAYTICKAHAFLLHRLVKADLGDDIGDEERNKWKQKLRETQVSTSLVELLAKDPNYGNYDANCEPEVAKEVVEKLITKEMAMHWPHFHYLNALIYQYDGFRRTVCNDPNRRLAKARMEELLGEGFLSDLELLHPDILQIENMLLSTRLFFYNHYLENFWNHPKKSKLIEMRIAIPLLLCRVREIEVQFRGNALMESHIEWLLVEIYHDLEHINARSICLLSRFINWNESNQLREKKSRKSKGKQVAAAGTIENAGDAYERELAECARSEEQEKAQKWQREVLAENHRKFLEEYQKETTKFLDMGMPGKKTVILQLAPGLKLEWNADSYTDDDQLANHFLTALFADDDFLADRLSAHFGVYFVSWHRWMESQMRKGKGKEPVFEKFAELWARAQPKILARHDALFCADVPLQKREKFYWAKMQAGLKDLLLRVPKLDLKEKNWSSLMSATFEDIISDKDEDWNVRWNLDLWTEFNRWIQRQNQMELLALWHWGWNDDANREEEFRQKFLERFRAIPAAKSRLIQMIGNEPKQLSMVEKALEIDLMTEEVSADDMMDKDFMKAEHKAESSKLETFDEVDPSAKEIL